MTTVSASEIVLRREGDVVVLALNRPHRRNALSSSMIERLGEAFEELSEAQDIGAVLLHGTQGFFCSGLDVKEIDVADAPRAAWARVHRALAAIDAPVVGALTGGAVNAGAALALACDLLVTGREAYLQVMEAAMGVQAPMNAAWLAQRYPAAVGLQLMLSGRRFTGDDLYRLGVALEVHPDAEVLTRAHSLAAELAGYPRRGAAMAKHSLDVANRAPGSFTARMDAVLHDSGRMA